MGSKPGKLKPKAKPFRVACLGNVLVDMLVKPVDRFPPPGGLSPVDRVEMAMGGCASNTAIALRRMGVTTSLWGKLGRDTFGAYALEQLRKDKVDTRQVRSDPNVSTSATLVLVDSKGQRSFLHSMAANDHIHPQDVSCHLIRSLNHLHIRRLLPLSRVGWEADGSNSPKGPPKGCGDFPGYRLGFKRPVDEGTEALPTLPGLFHAQRKGSRHAFAPLGPGEIPPSGGGIYPDGMSDSHH
jgi:hypothetical protein